MAMSCGVGRRCGLDPTLLWLWYRPAAVASIRPLAWELPYVTGAALKSKKKKKRKEIQTLDNYALTINHKTICNKTHENALNGNKAEVEKVNISLGKWNTLNLN